MTTPFRPTVRSQADLEAVWKHLMGPWGFGGHSVWMLVIDADDRPFPQITEITETLGPPDDEKVSSLAELIGDLAEPGRRFAFLRSRPGPGGVTDDDRAWARALYEAGRQARVSLEVVHRACDHDLVAVPMDDVIPPQVEEGRSPVTKPRARQVGPTYRARDLRGRHALRVRHVRLRPCGRRRRRRRRAAAVTVGDKSPTFMKNARPPLSPSCRTAGSGALPARRTW